MECNAGLLSVVKKKRPSRKIIKYLTHRQATGLIRDSIHIYILSHIVVFSDIFSQNFNGNENIFNSSHCRVIALL